MRHHPRILTRPDAAHVLELGDYGPGTPQQVHVRKALGVVHRADRGRYSEIRIPRRLVGGRLVPARGCSLLRRAHRARRSIAVAGDDPAHPNSNYQDANQSPSHGREASRGGRPSRDSRAEVAVSLRPVIRFVSNRQCRPSPGSWATLIDVPTDHVGPVTFVVTSSDPVTAVSTLQLELDPDAATQTASAFLEPVGDQREDILYQTGVRLSVFEPGECSGEPRPAVVFGGGVDSSLRDGLTSRGYVVVDVGWRTPGNSSSLDDSTVRALGFAVFDLRVALQWLRAQADELCIDEHRMAVAGYSFGAIAALLVTYHDGDLAAGDTITIPGFEGSAQVSLPRIEPPTELAGISDDPDAAISFAGFALADTIEAGEAPVLMIHGRNDGMVPFALAEQTCASAAAVGVTCELLVHDDGHALLSDTATLDRIDEFLRQELAIGVAG